ncbi:MAG: hypothetical protein ABI068_00910 [Ktedonobacterales bacterium]
MLAEIKDIYCAAFAIAKGAQLQDVTNRQGWTHFLFEATAVQQALAEWNQPQAQVDVHAYNNAMRYLRSIVRAQGTRVNGAPTTAPTPPIAPQPQEQA